MMALLTSVVRLAGNRKFPDRWIGRGGPIAWPPRSPDLNPLDFYLWGHLKSLVYSSPVPDLESLRNRIVFLEFSMRHRLRRLRWAGHVACMGESRNAYRVLIGRPEGKRPLGRPRRRWEDSIKMDLREMGHDARHWINLVQSNLEARSKTIEQTTTTSSCKVVAPIEHTPRQTTLRRLYKNLITNKVYTTAAAAAATAIICVFLTGSSKSNNGLQLPRLLTPILDHSPQLKSAGTAEITSASVHSFQFSDSCVVCTCP
ncbi:hypothetical protein ANN_16163 [Periplaneta americana]|uniref:Uncharacterized protein n=1 Tax=Periplaneta americana TaxID=6978 RepID=A0ABQ8SJG9_PERAM|nr:hypothetical protein ANN_16163 [Periplaneta americana]